VNQGAEDAVFSTSISMAYFIYVGAHHRLAFGGCILFFQVRAIFQGFLLDLTLT